MTSPAKASTWITLKQMPAAKQASESEAAMWHSGRTLRPYWGIQVYQRYIQPKLGYMTGTEQNHKVFTRYIPTILARTWQVQNKIIRYLLGIYLPYWPGLHITGIYHVNTRYVLCIYCSGCNIPVIYHIPYGIYHVYTVYIPVIFILYEGLLVELVEQQPATRCVAWVRYLPAAPSRCGHWLQS
jgi:hypothetical protein